MNGKVRCYYVGGFLVAIGMLTLIAWPNDLGWSVIQIGCAVMIVGVCL